MYRRLFFIILVVSPILSITGGNEFSTGLNLAALLNLPSLNFLNYLFQLFFLFLFLFFNSNRSWLNAILTISFAVFLLFLFRHPTLFSFIGLTSIYSCFLIFMDDRYGFTNLTSNDAKRLFKIYAFYILISVVIHGFMLANPVYYANDRMMGIFKNPNQMGFFLVAFYLFYILKIRKPEVSKYDYILPVVLTLLLIMTGSRSAIIAMIAINLIHFFILKKLNYFVVLAVLSIIMSTILFSRLGSDELLAMVSRRDVNALKETGNMRFEIFKDIFKEGSTIEIIMGRDVSIGTNGMIFEQKQNSEEIIWLDNLINVLAYNWGVIGILFFTMTSVAFILQNTPVVKMTFLVFVFFFVASLFFVVSDFFPLGFLLVYLKNDFSK
jgi:O-antigen ligase